MVRKQRQKSASGPLTGYLYFFDALGKNSCSLFHCFPSPLCGFTKKRYLWDFLPSRLGEIVIGLHFKPETRMRPERGREPKGHFSRDASAAIEYLGERYPRYANVFRHMRYIHAFQVGA